MEDEESFRVIIVLGGILTSRVIRKEKLMRYTTGWINYYRYAEKLNGGHGRIAPSQNLCGVLETMEESVDEV